MGRQEEGQTSQRWGMNQFRVRVVSEFTERSHMDYCVSSNVLLFFYSTLYVSISISAHLGHTTPE